MSLTIDRAIVTKKSELLTHLRNRANELQTEALREYGKREHKKVAKALNTGLSQERERLENTARQQANRDNWRGITLVQAILLIKHCSNVVMLEARNQVWEYEYMSFSRRIGELWEPLVATCFENAPNDELELFVPPVFADVRSRLHDEIRKYISELPLEDTDKQQLIDYYDTVWTLVDSGEIQLALDMHFSVGEPRYVVDFKSGFSSNEKGNTNRLLLVASIYKNVEVEDYRPTMLVRASEDANNNYLQRLRASGLWDVYCGDDTYSKIHEFTGFDLADWIRQQISWEQDFSNDMWTHLSSKDLTKYLEW